MKTKILNRIKELRNQRAKSEKIEPNNRWSEGWEDGYDDALDLLEDFVEEIK